MENNGSQSLVTSLCQMALKQRICRIITQIKGRTIVVNMEGRLLNLGSFMCVWNQTHMKAVFEAERSKQGNISIDHKYCYTAFHMVWLVLDSGSKMDVESTSLEILKQ